MTRPHRDPPLPSLTRPALATAIPSEASVWNVDVGRRWRIGTWTLLAALLLHMLPLLFWLWQLWHWPTQSGIEEPAIEVTLVQEPPKPVAPPAPPAPPPQPDFAPRESGPDQVTEAKKTEKPMRAPPKPAAPQKPTPAESSAVGLAPPKVDRGARELVLHLPSKGGSAAQDHAGDPYLNELMKRIELHRIFPAPELFNGAPGKNAIFAILMDPDGTISGIKKIQSTGVQKLDEYAFQMISNSTPLPGLPPDYPSMRVSIVVYMSLYPR